MSGSINGATSASASTNALITSADLRALGTSANSELFPSGNASAVVADGSSTIIVGQAAALAAHQGEPLVISDSTTDASGVLSQLSTLGSTHVELIGSSTSFSAGFISSLAEAATIDHTVAESDDFIRSTATAALASFDHLIVADSTDSAALPIAINTAVENGFALVITTGALAATAVAKDFFALHAGQRVTLIGTAGAQTQSIDQAETGNVEVVTLESPIQTTQDLGTANVVVGNQANNVFAAPSDQLGSISVSALLARGEHGVSLLAGPAADIGGPSSLSSYLTLWGPESEALTLVGTGLTSAQLTSAATPTRSSRATLPSFRATGTSPGVTTWNLSWGTLAGAAHYEVYDLFGTQLANTAATSAALAYPMTAVQVIGFDTSGTEIARFDFRVNQYDDGTDQQTAVIGSTSGGTSVLQFLGTLSSPRVVTRIQSDPFSEDPSPVTQVVAITCQPYFVDAGEDSTKQFNFTVEVMSGANNRACDSTASLNPTTFIDRPVSTVDLPPTTFPAFKSLSARTGLSGANLKRSQHAYAATPTENDTILLKAQGRSTAKSTVMSLAKSNGVTTLDSTLPDYVIRYQGFIPENLVPMPFIPPVFGHQLALAGDKRPANDYNPIGSYRFRMDTYFTFSTGIVSMTPSMGHSYLYDCVNNLTSCTVVNDGTASTSELAMTSHSMTPTVATARLVVAATVPVLPVAPAINATLDFKLSAGNSTIRGAHDRMPVHEIYGGFAQSEFFTVPIYQSTSHEVTCLFGPVIPGCRVDVNVTP